ncbi:hypothetical protein I553_6536 [Mycobacterium xenopi 4042]|uniref:Uncharacterized protein n=1 Tax=Mycobacterium xenopi 4042 TaxID=1299334 RepID=X8BGR3_MYCXE|nr:hypothetical protein I553_6536 [Mycobacterium xenopi 4042]
MWEGAKVLAGTTPTRRCWRGTAAHGSRCVGSALPVGRNANALCWSPFEHTPASHRRA